MGKDIRVLIADNCLEFAKAFQIYLEDQLDIEVVSLVRDGQGAVDASQEVLPDLVLIDLHLPVLDSIKTIRAILEQNEHIKILSISAEPNDRYAVEAVKVGARGFVKKNGFDSYHQIADAIRQVAAGEVVLDATLASRILQEFS